ncbi:uncharacterized protein BJ171DRAFT_497257 [Polychytrium aggregatum]|uniref:uncharacterized protein n=1 Tax=Polychytrium aggregatum TaxID=110093 RepID=UPI0022FEF38F|nr:uncharacterized protein BJ171DRAFT_497257 [Polychytrium aggregatum]KAI9206323.1 hypothetical protein BJ171DRAFT_497257 [Polychytrium aggregatum]
MSLLLRSSMFTLWGYQAFTKAGFLRASKSFDPNDLNVDLSGKVMIVTGANSGLGKVTALELAKRGAELHILCRSPNLGASARTELIEQSKNQNIHLHVVDISRPAMIKEFVSTFLRSKGDGAQLHVLVNNAGALFTEKTVTPDKLDGSFATNTLGTYYLTQLLIPTLEKTPGSRVVTVSSGGMYNARLDITDLQFERMAEKWNGVLAYAYDKRAQVELTELWAERHPKIHFFSMHPGVDKSLPSLNKYVGDNLRTPEQGADSIVWAACAKSALSIRSGAFIFDRQEAVQHLTLAGTQCPKDDVVKLAAKLDEIAASLV